MSDLSDVMEDMKRMSETFASGQSPDGDWQPMLLIFHGKEAALVSFQMPEHGWEREKLFMTLLPNMVAEKFPNPDMIVMLNSTWYAENWDENGPMPRDHPDRKEGLLIQGISRDEELSAMGEIKRSESHPELEWDSKFENAPLQGRLVGFLRRAVWT